MSLAQTKEQLIALLAREENQVIALSGPWGSGKTYLWNQVKGQAVDETVRHALYVSLFGLSSIDDVKRKLVEAAVPGSRKANPAVIDGLKQLFEVGFKVAADKYPALATLSSVNLLLVAPGVLAGKVVVVDDIERKHANLGVDELMGFIDEYATQYSTRFILVLNDDELSTDGNQRQLWKTFREKVLDQEIKITTSAKEAFDIAHGLVGTAYPEAMSKACITCGLTNIRIVCKILRLGNQVLGQGALVPSVQARVIPSIVLFAAIHYGALKDGPDFAFALKSGDPDWSRWSGASRADPTPDDLRQSRWFELMSELGIRRCDEFEQQLVAFLESGLLDGGQVEKTIARYNEEHEALEAREAIYRFLKSAVWGVASDQELLEQTPDLIRATKHIDAHLATALCNELSRLEGGAVAGDQVIDAWLTTYKAAGCPRYDYDDVLRRPLHPRLSEAFAAAEVAEHQRTSVLEAVLYISLQTGYTSLHEVALRRATASDFEAALRGIRSDDERRRVLLTLRDMHLHEVRHFGDAPQRFLDACRTIVHDETSPGLAKVIKRLFEGTALAGELEPQTDGSID